MDAPIRLGATHHKSVRALEPFRFVGAIASPWFALERHQGLCSHGRLIGSGPPAIGIFIGLAIATLKVSLVAAFFMHLKGERLLIYGLLAVTAFFALLLFLLPLRDFHDILHLRSPEATAEQTMEPAHVP